MSREIEHEGDIGFVEAFAKRWPRAVLETLLRDRTTGKNIIWADSEYEELGDGYAGDDLRCRLRGSLEEGREGMEKIANGPQGRLWGLVACLNDGVSETRGVSGLITSVPGRASAPVGALETGGLVRRPRLGIADRSSSSEGSFPHRRGFSPAKKSRQRHLLSLF